MQYSETNNACLSQGDSGGGVVFNGMIYGVHESSFDNTCPRISEFMDVCEYMDWIRRITGIHWTMSYNPHFTVNKKNYEFLKFEIDAFITLVYIKCSSDVCKNTEDKQ